MEYTGVGSRQTPEPVCRLMTAVACILEYHGFTLRSGAAPGADTAFERGVLQPAHMKIFLPWDGFEGRRSRFAIPREAYGIAAKYFPGLMECSQGIQKLMARNAQQVMGEGLDSPAMFVLCWTPDGCEHGRDRKRGRGKTGGTGQAIDHASDMGIPVFNMFNPGWELRFMELTEIDLRPLVTP